MDEKLSMKVSVVIPCLNVADTIGETLNALIAQRWPVSWEVVLADNGSTDTLKSAVSRYRGKIPKLRLINASTNSGASYARNVGVKAAHGDNILFCDADDVPGRGWASAMVDALMEHDFVAARLEFGKLNPQSVRTARGNTQVDALQRFPFLPFGHAGGGTLGIKRCLHEEVGGFDETIPTCEDIDYCMRVQQRGRTLAFVPGAVLHCRLRGTIRGVYSQGFHYAEYEVFLYKKYRARSGWELWRWRKYVQSWGCLLGRVLDLAGTPEGKMILIWRLGRLVGSLKGSIRFVVPPVIIE